MNLFNNNLVFEMNFVLEKQCFGHSEKNAICIQIRSILINK
jgi:hypothetical protein